MLSAPAGKLVDATATLPQASDYSHSACTGDINGDGHPDIYVGNIYGVNNITPRLLLNDGTGHFTIGGSLPGELEDPNFTARYTTCTFADVNADHVPDLGLRLGSDGQSTDFYTLDTNGIFHPQGSLGIQTALWSIADLNGDGRPDLVTVGQNTHTVFVTLSRPPRKATPKC